MSLVKVGNYLFNPENVVFVNLEYIQHDSIGSGLSETEQKQYYQPSEIGVLVKLNFNEKQGTQQVNFAVFDEDAETLREYFKDDENPYITFLP